MTIELFFTIFIVLQFCDGLSTYLVLTNGGRELNPFLDKIMKEIGIVPGLVQMKLLFLVVFYFFCQSFPIHEFAYYAVIAVYQVVILNNYRVYKGLK